MGSPLNPNLGVDVAELEGMGKTRKDVGGGAYHWFWVMGWDGGSDGCHGGDG